LAFAVVGYLMTLTVGSQAAPLSALNLDFLGRGGGTVGLAARVDDPDNVSWNASALAFGTRSMGYAGFMDYLVGVKGGTVGYMGRVSRDCGLGAWVSYLSSGSLTRTGFDDPVGQKGEAFTHTELVTGLALGHDLLPFLSLGGGLKVARQHLDGFSTSGLFADLSVTLKAYSPDPKTTSHPHIYTSYIARNFEVARWEEDGDDVGANSEIAVALGLPGSGITTGLSFYFAERGKREVRCGLEAALSDEFEVRLGYRRRTGRISDQASDLPWERGLTAGFGLGFGPLRLDYTYEDASPLDNIHRFAVRSAAVMRDRN
jgi:hypothetical protein